MLDEVVSMFDSGVVLDEVVSVVLTHKMGWMK